MSNCQIPLHICSRLQISLAGPCRFQIFHIGCLTASIFQLLPSACAFLFFIFTYSVVSRRFAIAQLTSGIHLRLRFSYWCPGVHFPGADGAAQLEVEIDDQRGAAAERKR